MKAVIDALKSTADKLKIDVSSSEIYIRQDEANLSIRKEELSDSKQRLDEIEKHIQSLEDDKNKNVIVGAGTFNKETDKASTKAIISAGEFVLPVKSQIIEEAYFAGSNIEAANEFVESKKSQGFNVSLDIKQSNLSHAGSLLHILVKK